MARRRRPISYFWALEPGPTDRLSEDALDGIDYARQLADDAQRRVQELLYKEPGLPPLTINDIADGCGRTPTTVRRCITRARKELYGDLSDAGIYYRRRRDKHLRTRPARTCADADCEEKLPWNASAGRRYCDQHHTPAARSARSRQNKPAA